MVLTWTDRRAKRRAIGKVMQTEGFVLSVSHGGVRDVTVDVQDEERGRETEHVAIQEDMGG